MGLMSVQILKWEMRDLWCSSIAFMQSIETSSQNTVEFEPYIGIVFVYGGKGKGSQG